MMSSRTWPILVVGFGTLILLIGVTGFGAAQRARQIHTEIVAFQESDRKLAGVLDEIHTGIHLSGLFVRDYLLDPSHLTAELHREQLLKVRKSMAAQLEVLDGSIGREEEETLGQLREEIDAYWISLDPVFEWTPRQKLAMSAIFLRQQVLPRRDAVLSLSSEIRGLAESNFRRQQQKLIRSQEELRGYLWWMLGTAISLGLLVAAASIFRTARLEKWMGEQRLRAERAERELRQLSQQLVQAQEMERKSLSRELHDEVGQMLTALRMELVNLEELRTAPYEQFRGSLEGVKQLAEQTLASVRNLAMGLRPAMLDDLGLGPALEWQGREFSRRSGIPVSVQIDGSLDELPDSHRTCIFRVVQEALTNCVRHAQAKSVRVTVHGGSDGVFVTVQDDGVGIAPEPAGRGLGLIGIEERARELGGSVAIYSQPNRGTTVKVEIPMHREVAT